MLLKLGRFMSLLKTGRFESLLKTGKFEAWRRKNFESLLKTGKFELLLSWYITNNNISNDHLKICSKFGWFKHNSDLLQKWRLRCFVGGPEHLIIQHHMSVTGKDCESCSNLSKLLIWSVTVCRGVVCLMHASLCVFVFMPVFFGGLCVYGICECMYTHLCLCVCLSPCVCFLCVNVLFLCECVHVGSPKWFWKSVVDYQTLYICIDLFFNLISVIPISLCWSLE